MPDNSPRARARNLGFVAPLTILVVIAALILVVWLFRRDPAPPAPAPQPPPPAEPVAKSPPVAPAPPPPIGRSDFIARAASGASDYASGNAGRPNGKDPMVGRRFQVKIPFGCGGVQVRPDGLQAQALYDAEANVARLSARPADWSTLPLILSLPKSADVEAAEGFWLPRPWTRGEGCPQAINEGASAATPTPPAAQTVGLVQIFRGDESRIGRRGDRPYEFVRKFTADDAALVAHDYRLVLDGEVTGFIDGSAARCWSESPDHRPVCLFAVRLDRVAFEDGETGEQLAEWKD